MPLTPRQQQILEVIRSFMREHGYPPTVREVGEAVGLLSPSSVQAHLVALEIAGVIRRDPLKPRTLVIAEDMS